MTSHFRWYASDAETVIPFQASYKFPTEASKSEKMTPRIPPKNGGIFTPGNVIRLEFPAQGYVNTRNTVLEFDVTLYAPVNGKGHTRFQNDIQSIFSRLRILYGGTPLEDIIDYHYVRRCMTEWTGTNQNGIMDQGGISDGIGGQVIQTDSAGTFSGHVNVRQKMIQGVSGVAAETTPATGAAAGADFSGGILFGQVGDPTPNPTGAAGVTVTRRYCVQLGAGLLNQDKLIPTKWMASQFAIELTLAQASDCIYSPSAVTVNAIPLDATYTANYAVSNVNLIPEILQFDPSYDEAFLQGLKSGGVVSLSLIFSRLNSHRGIGMGLSRVDRM